MSSAAYPRADLLRLPGRPLAKNPDQQPARAHHERDPTADPCRWCVSGWPVLSQPGSSSVALHRRNRTVDQAIHEYAAALSTADHANRSRRLINVRKIWTPPADRQRVRRGVQQPLPGGMPERALVTEPCRCTEKVGGLAQRPHGAIGQRPPITLHNRDGGTQREPVPEF